MSKTSAAGATVLMSLKNKMQSLRDELDKANDELEDRKVELDQEKAKRMEVGVTPKHKHTPNQLSPPCSKTDRLV